MGTISRQMTNISRTSSMPERSSRLTPLMTSTMTERNSRKKARAMRAPVMVFVSI